MGKVYGFRLNKEQEKLLEEKLAKMEGVSRAEKLITLVFQFMNPKQPLKIKTSAEYYFCKLRNLHLKFISLPCIEDINLSCVHLQCQKTVADLIS